MSDSPTSPKSPAAKRSTAKPTRVRPLSPGTSAATIRLTRGKKSRLEPASSTKFDQRELESLHGDVDRNNNNNTTNVPVLPPAAKSAVVQVVMTKSKRLIFESDSELEDDNHDRETSLVDKGKKRKSLAMKKAAAAPVPGKAVEDASGEKKTATTTTTITMPTAKKTQETAADKDTSGTKEEDKKPATGSTSKAGKAPKRDIITELLAKKAAAAAAAAGSSTTSTSTTASTTPVPTPTTTTDKGKVADEFSLANMLEDRKRRQQRGADLRQIEKILSNKQDSKTPLNTEEDVDVKAALQTSKLDDDEKEKIEDMMKMDKDKEETVMVSTFDDSSCEEEARSFDMPAIASYRKLNAVDLDESLLNGVLQLENKMERIKKPSEEWISFLQSLVLKTSNAAAVQVGGKCLHTLITRGEWVITLKHVQETLGLFGLKDKLVILDSAASRDGSNKDDESETEATQRTSLVCNLTVFINLLRVSLSIHHSKYSHDDLIHLFHLCIKTLIDHRVQKACISQNEVFVSLCSLIKQSGDWEESKQRIYQELTTLVGSDSKVQRLVVDLLPLHSAEVRDLQRFIAHRFLVELLGEPVPPPKKASKAAHFEDMLMCNSMFVIHAQTDYGVLFRTLYFLNACLAGRDFLKQEPDSVEHIAMKLKQINSRIADPRAAFIERTRVKDFILRLGLRIKIS